MRQIPLALDTAGPASFDNYVAGGNDEALAVLRSLAAATAAAPPAPAARAVYLWGEPGTGKTHLLDALAATLGGQAIRLGPDAPAPAAVRFILRGPAARP